MEELTGIIALSRLKGLNNIQKRAVLEKFNNIAPLFEGRVKIHNAGLQDSIASFNEWKGIGTELETLEKMGVDILTIKDKTYPETLKNIPDPPIVLYKKGSLEYGMNTLAIVGSRRATFEGMNLAEKIGHTLSSLGVTIVSGLARGIDASAHKGALKGKGKTIGVLGCGINICYPSENRWLFEKIGEEGTLLTEYSLGERPLNYHFPERNRIIAGLSKGVLVIEASKKSGSLITAKLGLEYGREVMAIPGSIFNDEYKGANTLIKEGAKLIDGIEDIIINCFPNLELKKEQKIDMDEDEEYIYSIIGFDKIHIDEVIEKSKMEAKRVMAIFTGLEMKEAIREVPGGFYIRK
ncbi:MAG: DNA-processing protein DprA [Proteobacteria bacterium]|nr:DNA-processing protein DprA [Pseudomonadota bacterium]